MIKRTRWLASSCVALATMLVLVAPLPAAEGAAGDEDRWVFGFGRFDDDPGHSNAVHLERRAARDLGLSLKPFETLLITTDGGVFGGVGVYHDLHFTGSLYLTPRLGVGLYHEGGDKDLGSLLQFQAGGNLAWRFASGLEVGWMYEHLGNAGLGSHDPGAETCVWTVAVPFGPGGPPDHRKKVRKTK